MTAPTSSPLGLLRSMMHSIDSGIEDAIDAHGFSFSALSADDGGAILQFATAAGSDGSAWHLTLKLPPGGRSRLALRHGPAEAPDVSLALSVGDGPCTDLPAALGIAMDLFTAVGQP